MMNDALSPCKRRLLVSAVSALLALALLWVAWFFIRPAWLAVRAEQLLGREGVISLSSWQAPWLYMDTEGVLRIKRERVRGDTLVIPDVMDGVPVTEIGDTGGVSHGVKVISLPPSVTEVTFWNDQFSDATRLAFRSGCSLGAELGLYRFSVGIELCLPREIALLEAEAFHRCDGSLVIRYAGSEAEWLALGEDAALIAAEYTVIFEDEE